MSTSQATTVIIDAQATTTSTPIAPPNFQTVTLSTPTAPPAFQTVTLSVQNTGDQIIRCEIPSANFNKFIGANSIESVNLNLCQTYNIKLTKGRFSKNTNYTPSSEGATLDIERYYL